MKSTRSFSVRGLAALSVLAFALSMMILPTAFASAPQSKQDFELHNNTGYTISEVYVSETGNENWEEDVLGEDELPNGGSVNITFSGQKANNWDLKIVFTNGHSEYWRKLNLSELTDVTIAYKAGKPVAFLKNGG